MLFLKNINEEIPNDIRWHKTLFEKAFGKNSKNINIIRNDVKEPLERYLSFRHFIRHAYSSELEWDEMEILVNNLENIWTEIKFNFESFIKNDLN